jgi:hypothetical protein
MFDKIGADLQRQERFYATKAPKQSNTAADQYKILKQMAEAPHNMSWFEKLLGVREGVEAAEKMLPAAVTAHPFVAATAGAALYGAKKVLSAARNKGLAKASDMYHEAVMNPDRAADLLSRPNPGSHRRLANAWQRQAMYAGLAGERPMVLRRAQ